MCPHCAGAAVGVVCMWVGGGGGGVGGGGGGGVVGVAGVDVKVELIEQDYRVTERGKSQIC